MGSFTPKPSSDLQDNGAQANDDANDSYDTDTGSPLGALDDLEDVSEPTSEQQEPTPSVKHSSYQAYKLSQSAGDVERRSWDWSSAKDSSLYKPVSKGKWWSAESLRGQESAQRDNSHIGRIMETELGEQLHGNERCTQCVERNEECWTYTAEGARQLSRPGDSCARCRRAARTGGCSLSKRKRKQRRGRGSSSPPSRPLVPKPGDPPPPAGGDQLVA